MWPFKMQFFWLWSQGQACLFLFLLIRYKNHEIALNCGVMLRECIRYEPLARKVLKAEEFYNFFDYVEMSTFDIASDAFTTFKVTNHQQMVHLINLAASSCNHS